MFCKWALKLSISISLGAALTAGYNEQAIPGEDCTEVLPDAVVPSLGFLKKIFINGSDEMLFPLGLCHCWGREVHSRSSGTDLVLVK